MNPKYTEEQVKDIEEREKKGLEALKELGLTPACRPMMQNIGNDVFATKLVPYLQDTKYSLQTSPIQQEDLPPPMEQTNV